MSWREQVTYISIIGITISFLCIIILTVNLKNTGDMTDGDYVIGLGTLALAFGTAIMALNDISEGRSNRKLDRDLAQKDRRRLRLKEQFEGLYSPLMSCIEFIDNRNAHNVDPLNSLMPNLRGKFEFLAKEDLKVLLREYYATKRHPLSDAEWLVLTESMKDAIGIGWADLSAEYDGLTGDF